MYLWLCVECTSVWIFILNTRVITRIDFNITLKDLWLWIIQPLISNGLVWRFYILFALLRKFNRWNIGLQKDRKQTIFKLKLQKSKYAKIKDIKIICIVLSWPWKQKRVSYMLKRKEFNKNLRYHFYHIYLFLKDTHLQDTN